jgi:DNA-binding NarL/FixJ family response regulator
MINVLVVDDHAIVRHGLRQLFETTDDIVMVGEATDGEQAIAMVRDRTPGLVLMDLSMPGLDGIEATRRIVEEHPGIAVVVLTSFGEKNRILSALDAGAVGYLLKHMDPEEILEAVRAVAEGGAPLDPKVARVLLEARAQPQPAADLTQREREVLQLLADGLPNKQIALRLGITERTVKAHLTSVFQAIGVTDRMQAALWARDNLPGAAAQA